MTVPKLYFAFLEKGIQMAFYDAGYIDTELHCLNTRPSADQKLMITKNIQNYYRTHNNHPVLSDSERAEYSMMDWAKKNKLIERTREDTILVLGRMHFDATIRKALTREGVTSERTYKRRFKGGLLCTPSATLPANIP